MATRWRDWIKEGYAKRSAQVRPEFRDGARPEQLDILEAKLGVHLPMSLRELLLESNGVEEFMNFGDTWGSIATHVWPCDEMVRQNLAIRADPNGPAKPSGSDALTPLYLANAGVDGILFAFLLPRQGGADDPPVYAYYPIGDEWSLVSPSLKAHMHGWVV